MEKLLLGVDVGTTNVKSVLFQLMVRLLLTVKAVMKLIIRVQIVRNRKQRSGGTRQLIPSKKLYLK